MNLTLMVTVPARTMTRLPNDAGFYTNLLDVPVVVKVEGEGEVPWTPTKYQCLLHEPGTCDGNGPDCLLKLDVKDSNE